MLYERNDVNFGRGRFRVRGDVVEVYPAVPMKKESGSSSSATKSMQSGGSIH